MRTWLDYADATRKPASPVSCHDSRVDDTARASDKGTTNTARAQQPGSKEFRDFITKRWAKPEGGLPPRLKAASYARERRARLSARFPTVRIVVPAGGLLPRSNDTDFRFRPRSDFSYLTGLGSDFEPEAVLVMEPSASGHDSTLYVLPPVRREGEGFYSDPRRGEFWIGRRPGLREFEAMTGLTTRDLADLPPGIRLGSQPTRPVARALSEARMVKDDYETAEMRRAIAATVTGFERVVRELPRAIAHRRGERVVESVFDGHAREEGNGIGYETIAAAGPHATTLHWIANDGPVREGDLLLLDAGVEVESLYTADLTRTLPVSGTFTRAQRKVYDVVLEAADAAFAVVRPGATLREVHAAAMGVIELRLSEWGIVPPSKDPKAALYRRWMVHSTSHHLGLDVHDCSAVKRDVYLDGPFLPGMLFTIEPGLYFKEDDLAVPPEFRGIGIRIEDDALVTADGVENLSAALPRRPDDIEAWMLSLRRPRA
ncbi:MAG: aminopeptidase P family protein [Demequinaceae bacterium]|nr:aminopeptidase P family protein [Demequinaceae bacterium]